MLHCEPQRQAIAAALAQALALDCSEVRNPYGDGRSAARIVSALRALPPAAELLQKSFHNV